MEITYVLDPLYKEEDVDEAQHNLRARDVQHGLTSLEYYGKVEPDWSVMFRDAPEEGEGQASITVVVDPAEGTETEIISNLDSAVAELLAAGTLERIR